MQCIKKYIGLEKIKVVIKDYDNKIFIRVLGKVYHFLNPRHTYALIVNLVVLNDSLFEALISQEEIIEGFLRIK
jgi:hypothetical protein